VHANIDTASILKVRIAVLLLITKTPQNMYAPYISLSIKR